MPAITGLIRKEILVNSSQLFSPRIRAIGAVTIRSIGPWKCLGLKS